MNKIVIIALIISMILCSCKKEIDYSNLESVDIESVEFDPEMMEISTDEDVEIYHEATGNYPDGTYCAEVEYYNPNNGTRNTYDLDVEVEAGELTIINWPNGGWLDDTHFSPENISSGEVEFTSDKGYQYTITLGDYGGCGNTDEYKIRRDVNNDVEEGGEENDAETCPECGFSKFSTDNLCSSCERKVTCPNCGGSKNKYDDLCSSCKITKEQEEQQENEN